MSKKSPPGAHLTKNLCRVELFGGTLNFEIFICAHHPASKVTVLGGKKGWIWIFFAKT